MTDTFLIQNGVVSTGGARPRVIEDGAVAWTGDSIVAVGERERLGADFPDARTLDARGGLIMPGLVNLHHHFYSALARGLDPGRSMSNFGEVLENLWWRLDRALSMDTVRLSALLSVADCIRWGCTTVFDHHASPSCVRGSLDTIAEAVEEAGLSAVLCYEISDRNGHHEALAGVDENLEFIAAHRDHPRIRGMLGLHASFTVRDETLDEVGRKRPEGSGCHIHLAEDPLDLQASKMAFGAAPVERLVNVGLVDEQCLLAHGIHLGRGDYETIARYGAVLIHNPESNANNGVGRLDVVKVSQHGCLVGLGTDGMSSNMLSTLRAAFLAHRGGRRDPSTGFEVLPELLWNNVTVARRFFDQPLLGELVSGAPADLVVVDAAPPTPITADNLFGHLVYGASGSPIRHTVARGSVLLEDFSFQTLNPQELADQARQLSPTLWERFQALDSGPSVSGM
jgi:putative selenium metabolism protein SsnA